MSHFALFFRNFLACAFRKKTSFLVHFAAPPAAFLAMFFLLRAGGGESFAGAQAFGTVVYFTMIQAVMIASLSMRDREEGVLRRVLVSPAPGFAYAAGNGAAAFVVLAAQATLSAGLVCFAFPPGAGLDFFRLLPALLCFAWAAVGFASLVCSLSGSSSEAMISANVIILFSSLLGGSFFPVEFMNPAIRRIAFAFPQFWAMKAIGQARSGAPAGGAALALLVLLLFGFLFLSLQAAARRKGAEPA